MRILISLWPLLPLTVFSSAVNAEVLSLSFTDTNNTLVEVDVSNKYYNPNTDITFSMSGGLDRKLSLKLEDINGIEVTAIESGVIGVNDRITALGRDYYGKELTLSAPNDGTYTVVAEILNLSGEVIQTNTYPIIIDTTAPTLGAPQATSYGGLDGIDMPADTWYTGYYSTNKYYVSEIADDISGISRLRLLPVLVTISISMRPRVLTLKQCRHILVTVHHGFPMEITLRQFIAYSSK